MHTGPLQFPGIARGAHWSHLTIPCPELLKENGVYNPPLPPTISTTLRMAARPYHQRYSSWGFQRGQEGDLWKGEVANPEIPETVTVRELRSERR